MLNKVLLKGSLGKDPEVKKTQDGRDVATFLLATHVTWKDSNNEWQTTTDWHRVTIFKESTVHWIRDVLKKGDTVLILGKLANHTYIAKDGSKRVITHVVVSGWEGKVEYLRSSKTTQEQENEVAVLEVKTEHQETHSEQEVSQENEEPTPQKSQKTPLASYHQ